MAFPAIQTTSSGSATSSTSFSITLPSSISAGDLLICIATCSGNVTMSGSAGWTQANGAAYTYDSALYTSSVFYKTAAGSDTLTVTTGALSHITYICFRVTGQGSGFYMAQSNPYQSINPPNLNPGVGAKDFLWIAAETHSSGTGATTAAPSSYTSSVSRSPGIAYLSSGYRELNASSEDPGAFSGTAYAIEYCLFTIAIEPGSTSITGDASITQAGDSVSASGTVAVAGAASVTQAGDSASAAGTVAVAGAVSITQAGDSPSGAGTVAIAGDVAVTQAGDSVSGAGAVAISGAAAITQAGDSLAAEGTVSVSGAASISQAGDSAAAEGQVSITGDAGITQQADSLSAAGAVAITGEASITQADDTLSASGSDGEGAVAVAGDASISQAADTVAAAGAVDVAGAGSATQEGDSGNALGAVAISGTATISQGADTISAAGTVGTATPEPYTAATVEHLMPLRTIRHLMTTCTVRNLTPNRTIEHLSA